MWIAHLTKRGLTFASKYFGSAVLVKVSIGNQTYAIKTC